MAAERNVGPAERFPPPTPLLLNTTKTNCPSINYKRETVTSFRTGKNYGSKVKIMVRRGGGVNGIYRGIIVTF